MKRQHILKQMGVMVLSAVLSLTPAMQVAAAVPEDGTQILETEDSAEADTASATQEESTGEETLPAETEVTPTKEVTASPEPETEESTAQTTEESTAETTTETTEETTEESTEQKTEENTAETAEESTTETTGEEDAEDAAKQEDAAGAGNANALTLSDTEGQEAEDPDAQQASENQQVQAQDADTADDQSGYDINKPVIEDVWLPQSGQTLTTEDTLEIRVQAYDADSGIASVRVGLGFGRGNTNAWTDTVYLELDEEQQNYVGMYPLTDILATDGCITSLTVTDNTGNYISEYNWEGSMLDQEDCRFQIQQEELVIDSEVTALDFKNQGSMLNVYENLEASLQLSAPLDEDLSPDLYLTWENQETHYGITWYMGRPVDEDGTYEDQYTTGNHMDNGKWILTGIYVSIQGEQYPLNTDAIGSLSDYWFELQGSTEEEEPENPIEEVILDPCGETVRPGDTVSLKVKAAGNDQKWSQEAWADFYPAVDIDWGQHFSVDLTYNPDTQMFEGSYTVTEETYPTEWYLESVYFSDINGGDSSYFRTDEIMNAEYYFLVENDGTFTNPSFDVNVQFQALDVNGYYNNEVASFNKTNVLRRTTYAEAGITAPEAPDYIPEGLQFVGWVDSQGNPFDSEEQLLYGSYETFYAQYDQRMFTVYYSYSDQSGIPQSGTVQIFAPQEEITYGELRTLILEQMPDISDKVEEGLGFKGWEISFFNSDDETVSYDDAYFRTTPVYENVMVSLSYQFLNSDGTNTAWTYENIILDKDTTIGELRQVVAEHAYPEEGYQDAGFVSWELQGNLDDDDVLQNSSRFTASAVYEKAVAVGNFSYISEDGNYASMRKAYVLEAGSTYGDLKQEIAATAVPEDNSPEMGFVGWEISDYAGDDTPLAALASVSVDAVYENALVRVYYTYVNAEGNSTRSTEDVIVSSGSTVNEILPLVEGYDLPETYEGLTFEKWELPEWMTGEETVNGIYGLTVNADYGDPAVFIRYEYATENRGVIQYKYETVQIPEGTTYGELENVLEQYEPTDAYNSENANWNYSFRNNQDNPVVNLDTIFPDLSYENYTNLQVSMSYVTEKGEFIYSQHLWVLENGTTYQELREELSALPVPETYPGIQFQGWTVSGPTTGVVDDLNPPISMIAQYDKYVIHYIVDSELQDYEYVWDIPDDMDFDVDQIILADPGEELQLPTELGGYTGITWINAGDEDTITVNLHTSFYGYGTKTGTEPEDPEEPSEPENPSDPETPVEPENPTDPETPEEPTVPETPVVPETPEDTSRLPEELENVVVQEITAAQPGQTVTVDMQSASVVTKEMLGAAKGKDVNIQLNLGGYSWTINGMDIMASDLSDIDLEVKQNTGAIPSRVIQSLAGDNPVQQLSLTHNGDFGFRASLTINVGSENSGKYGNLYYYDSTGKMVFMNAGVIDANGNVTLSFSHASEYLIVVNDRVMSNDDVPADLRPGTDTSGGAVTTPVSTGNTSADNTSVTRTDKDVVNTTDATPTAWAGVFLLVALALAGAGVYQKRRKA